MPSKLESALALAARGFRVFPLHPNSKIPAIDRFPQRATTDPSQIRDWWQCDITGTELDCNIGIATGQGLVVIDLDEKLRPDGTPQTGLAEWADIDFLDESESTFRVDTPSNGRHLYFLTGKSWRNSVKKFSPSIDVRGEGGYVVAPGSVVDGKPYHALTNAPPSPLPSWAESRLTAFDRETRRVASETAARDDAPLALDEPADIGRAVAWLKTHEPAVLRSGSNAHTYQTFAKIKDFGISQHLAVELALDHWNERCSPPWPPDKIARVAENAYRYGENRIGQSSPSADFDPVPEKVGDLLNPVYPFNPFNIPPRDWVFGHLAIAGKVSMLVAPPGVGKSTFTFAMALSKITGRPLLNIDPKGAAPVAIWNNEDDMEELRRRLAAVMQHFAINQKDLLNDGKPLLFLNSGEDREFRIAKRGGSRIVEADLDGAAVALRSAGVRLFIADPLAETHPADENDNSEMRDVLKLYRRLAQMAQCGVLLVAHSRKPDAASAKSYYGDMNTLRGASAQSGVARAMFTFYSMAKDEAREHGVDPKQAYRYARLDDAKANLSLSVGEPLWFERVSVTLPGSNESVGVLAPANLKQPADAEQERERALVNEMEAVLRQATGYAMATKALVRALMETPSFSGISETALAQRVRRLFDEEESRWAQHGQVTRRPSGREYRWEEGTPFD